MQIAETIAQAGGFQTLEQVMGSVLTPAGTERMGQIAAELCRQRREAITARAISGIEVRWHWCNMAFSGDDEVTAGASSGEEFYKSTAGGGTLITKRNQAGSCRSTAVLNITAPAVEFAGWAVLNLAAPTEKQRWKLIPTPMTDVDEMLQFVGRLPEGVGAELKAVLAQQKVSTEEEIVAVEKQIKDWFAESPVPFRDMLQRLFEDSPRMGSGVMKGPVPMRGEKGIQPGFRTVDVQNLFPAADCGFDIRQGSYCFERGTMSKRKLLQKRMPAAALDGWLTKGVEKVLREGPKGIEGVGASAVSPQEFEIWYYYGLIPKDAFELVDLVVEEGLDSVWASVALINEEIVKIGPAPLENEIPYHLLKWRKRWIGGKEHWAGRGIAEEGEYIQRSATAHLRNLNDNSALAAVPQRIHWKGVVAPMNKIYEWAPGKDWVVENKEFTIDNIKAVANAFQFIDIPSHLPELRANIEMDIRLFQKVTGIDEMMMGQAEVGSVGGGQIQLNAAAHLPRRVKAYYDASVLRPAVTLSLAWIRRYKKEELPLGEATVTIEGSATEIKRDVQAASLVQSINLATNPIFGHDPALLMDKYLEGNEFDPDATRLTPERAQELAALLQPGPDEKAQAAVKSAELRAGALTEQGRMKAEGHQLDTVLTAEDAARNREHDKEMLAMKMKMDLIQYAQKKGIDLQAAQQELEAVKIPEMAVSADLAARENTNVPA